MKLGISISIPTRMLKDLSQATTYTDIGAHGEKFTKTHRTSHACI